MVDEITPSLVLLGAISILPCALVHPCGVYVFNEFGFIYQKDYSTTKYIPPSHSLQMHKTATISDTLHQLQLSTTKIGPRPKSFS